MVFLIVESIVFRVIYRWEVEPQNFDKFVDVWRTTTNRIHASVPGALGSFMLRGHEKTTEVLTIAKWASFEDWEAFWGNANPAEMEDMRALGTRISVESYSEVEDHTR